MMFLQDLKKIARFTRKYMQLFLSFRMPNNALESLFSDENLTEFATN
jgi:hypothetical protein